MLCIFGQKTKKMHVDEIKVCRLMKGNKKKLIFSLDMNGCGKDGDLRKAKNCEQSSRQLWLRFLTSVAHSVQTALSKQTKGTFTKFQHFFVWITH